MRFFKNSNKKLFLPNFHAGTPPPDELDPNQVLKMPYPSDHTTSELNSKYPTEAGFSRLIILKTVNDRSHRYDFLI